MKKYIYYILVFIILFSCTAQQNKEGGEVVFSLGSTFSRKANKYAVADSAGVPVTDYIFDNLQGLSNNCILAYRDSLYYILSKSGEQITSCGFNEFNYCYNGCAIIKRGGKYGLVKINGKEILPSEYTSVSFITPYLAAATIGDYTTIVDNCGNSIANTTDSLENVLENVSYYVSVYNEKLMLNQQAWDNVIDYFNSLCDRCIEAKLICNTNKKESEKLIRTLLKEAAIIDTLLQSTNGKMTYRQKERFNKISNRYHNHE